MKRTIKILTCLFTFLFSMTYFQGICQPTPETVNKIKEALKKIEDLKKAGKADDDPAIKDLAKTVIHMTDTAYHVPADNATGEPDYEPATADDSECKEGVRAYSAKSGNKVIVKICPYALTGSPGRLASTKVHEMVGHGAQAAAGNWYTDGKGTAIQEVEAIDRQLKDSTNHGLTAEEIAEIKRNRQAYLDELDEANKKKVNSGDYLMAFLPPTDNSRRVLVSRSEVFVAGTVLSEERMQVTVRGTKLIEGMVVSAELDGKKTEARTNSNGNAILDFSVIAGGLAGTSMAVIKLLDSKGNVIQQTNTTVEPGHSQIFNRPEIGQLPANLPKGEIVTIPGKNLGADAQLVCGEQKQETLSASDKELTVFTDSKTGVQPVFVITPNGVSESQDVNIYSIDFSLTKNSITPKEKVQAQVNYESIPVGTKLIFTNKSPETVTVTIPGAVNSANECIYTVSEENGSLPVNITGIIRGSFTIALDADFKDQTNRASYWGTDGDNFWWCDHCKKKFRTKALRRCPDCARSGTWNSYACKNPACPGHSEKHHSCEKK